MNVHDRALSLWESNKDGSRWSSDSLSISIEYLHEERVYFVTYSITYQISYKNTTTLTIACDTVEKGKLKLKCGHSDYDVVIKELLNPKAGVDMITFSTERYQRTTYHGSWPNEIQSISTTELVYCDVMMYANNKLHHNYKPAVVLTNGSYITSIEFYKNGKRCIPPEQRFPSLLRMLPVNADTRDACRQHIKKSVSLSPKALTKLYSRVPKTRWNQMRGIYYYYDRCNQIMVESYHWDDQIIPDEILGMVQWPLSDVDMFTIMLGCS